MKRHVTRVALLLLLSFVAISDSFSQTLPDSVIAKIDHLFIKWNNKNSPGCAIGIVRNDSLIYSKGYGMANLEYGIPNTPETIFYMASVSKQFTAYSIVLLARQGMLKLEDDIRVYLAWAQNFGKKITIRNLLNHTSGIRDVFDLAAISGLGADGMITQEFCLNILRRQHSLNFTPGEKYSYSNSNFILLTEIVKNVSGKSFSAFVDSAIFKPLGMMHSHFEDNYTELIKNRAESYATLDSFHFENNFKNVFTFGDGGLFSNINDMAKWITNFYKPRAGDVKDIEQLTTRGKLNDGKEIQYALGIIVDSYRGWRMFRHEGFLAGYCTKTTVYPDLKMGFIVFGNQGDFSTYSKNKELADIFIEDTTLRLASESKSINSIADVNGNPSFNLKNVVGDYLSDDGMQMRFQMKNNNLYVEAFGLSFLLSKDKSDSHTYFTEPDFKFSFSSNPHGDNFVLATFSSDEKYLLKQYITDTYQTNELLRTYTGTYFCPELDCSYKIILKEHDLYLISNKYNDARLTLVGANHLLCDLGGMNHLLVAYNKLNQITGFEVNSGGVRHLKFEKIK